MASCFGCAHASQKKAPVLASHVEVPRFMGDWYVIASIPVFLESDSYNSVESYRLDPEARILTTYTFNKGGFDGPVKTYHPIGKVYDHTTNAEWRMRFLWPFTSGYLIHYVDDAYSTTIVGEPKKEHVWIMARSPQITDETYRALVARVGELGYATAQLRRVPQSPRTTSK